MTESKCRNCANVIRYKIHSYMLMGDDIEEMLKKYPPYQCNKEYSGYCGEKVNPDFYCPHFEEGVGV
jgi:hypothetical protein